MRDCYAFLNWLFLFASLQLNDLTLSSQGDGDSVEEEPGLTISPGSVVCPLPLRRAKRSPGNQQQQMVQRVSLSLSNDGQNYSSSVTVVIFDSSTCVTCSTATCFIKVCKKNKNVYTSEVK